MFMPKPRTSGAFDLRQAIAQKPNTKGTISRNQRKPLTLPRRESRPFSLSRRIGADNEDFHGLASARGTSERSAAKRSGSLLSLRSHLNLCIEETMSRLSDSRAFNRFSTSSALGERDGADGLSSTRLCRSF